MAGGVTVVGVGCDLLVGIIEDPKALAALWAVAAHHTPDGTGSLWRLWSALATIGIGCVLAALGRAPQVGGWFNDWTFTPGVGKNP